MAEISGHAVTFADIEAQVLALGEIMPKGAPDWAHHDLTFGQLRLLFMLGQSGPVSIGQLADKMGVTDATASEFVDRVERRGLAIRTHRADDRRVVDCELSDDGSRLLAEIAGARQAAMRQVFTILTPEELGDVYRLLRIVTERLASATQSSVSTEGGTYVNSGEPLTSPAHKAGGGPA